MRNGKFQYELWGGGGHVAGGPSREGWSGECDWPDHRVSYCSE